MLYPYEFPAVHIIWPPYTIPVHIELASVLNNADHPWEVEINHHKLL